MTRGVKKDECSKECVGEWRQGHRFAKIRLCGYMYLQQGQMDMLRSYHHESTRSHQNSEVKRGWARLVLG